MTEDSPSGVSDSKLEPYDSEWADRIYQRLRPMDVVLDEDPLGFPPKRINNKIAQARKYVSECQGILLEVDSVLHAHKRRLRLLDLFIDTNKKQLLLRNPQVRAERSAGEREAFALSLMSAQVAERGVVSDVVEEMSVVRSVLQAKIADLKDIQSRIKDQLQVCKEEISLGGRWGSNPARTATPTDPAPSAPAAEDIHPNVGLLFEEAEASLPIVSDPMEVSDQPSFVVKKRPIGEANVVGVDDLSAFDVSVFEVPPPAEADVMHEVVSDPGLLLSIFGS